MVCRERERLAVVILLDNCDFDAIWMNFARILLSLGPQDRPVACGYISCCQLPNCTGKGRQGDNLEVPAFLG